jgi:3-oxoacyl-[acyl-carrier-protein] synthase III
MKILTVQHAVPERRVTNEDCLNYVYERANGRLNEEDRVSLRDELRVFLEACGTDTRYICNDGAKAIDYALRAGQAALDESGVAKEDIEFVIYTGVARGWVEPAMANVIQAELKLKNATCFDMLDACASWIRALQVSHSFIKSKVYRCGMIVNCECAHRDHLHSDVDGIEELRPRLASFTIGEAATATIVNHEQEDDDLYFAFKTFGEHFRLCMIPLNNVARFMPSSNGDGYIPGKFYVQSKELVSTTVKKVVETYRSDRELSRGGHDIVFIHAASQRSSDFVLKRLRIPKQLHFPTHGRFGNTVSASVPLGMSLAVQENRLKRGDKVLIIVGSAGISVGFVTFTF